MVRSMENRIRRLLAGQEVIGRGARATLSRAVLCEPSTCVSNRTRRETRVGMFNLVHGWSRAGENGPELASHRPAYAAGGDARPGKP